MFSPQRLYGSFLAPWIKIASRVSRAAHTDAVAQACWFVGIVTDRVMALGFPAGYRVIFLLGDAAIQLGDLIRTILQSASAIDHHICLGRLETGVQRGGFTVIAPKPNTFYKGVICFQLPDHLPRPVAAAVVNQHDLVGKLVFSPPSRRIQ